MSTSPHPEYPGALAALERWSQASARLGLASPAARAGALLLAAEIDEHAHRRLSPTAAATLAPRRADILRALATEIGEAPAALGLAGLEERGVAAPLSNYAGPWLQAEIELDRRVRAHCLGAAPPPVSPATLDAHPLPRVELALQHAAARCAGGAAHLLVVLRGRPGSGRDLALHRFLGTLALPMLRRSPHELRQPADPLEPELSGSAAVWDPRRTDPSPDDHDLARRWLARSPTVAVAVLDRHQDAPDVDGRIVLPIDLDPRDAAERRAGWNAALHRVAASRALIEEAAADLARRCRAGAGLAARAALMMAERDVAGAADIVAAAERELAALVRPSTTRGILVEHPSLPLAHIVAGADVLRALQQIVLLARLSSSLETPGRAGVKALLSGPSGTGKTMAARAIATELRLPLYRVDLAGVVSKWVGETEKNLRDALTAAETAGAVLLFDEGDALFGKRGEVSRGSDRYANMEVAYLLQAVEAYDGIAVVTTNVRGNVDKAFERRFDACIELHPPTADEREAIWRQELGESGDGLPQGVLADVAGKAELNGGSIAAAARIARVLALHQGRERVGEQDLREAVRGELLKAGSSVQAARWTVG